MLSLSPLCHQAYEWSDLARECEQGTIYFTIALEGRVHHAKENQEVWEI